MFTLFAHRIVLGRLFKSFGAAHVNERSSRVVRLLNAGYFNKSVSELVLRLCLPGFFSSLSSDRYRGARPLRVLYTNNNILHMLLDLCWKKMKASHFSRRTI